jgi:3-methyladenine DNA glycosylase AlkD
MNFKAKQEPEPMYSLYLQKTRFINNWDLVDLSAPTIIGEYLMHKDPIILYTLARSLSLWERRIAIVSTHAFIKEGKAQYTLELSEILMNDTQDLIHKAVGWMLREVGKRCSLTILEKFLNKHAPTMPRTMLRYAIEHLSPEKKKLYMHARKTNKFISLA